jgi:hypothetical protein
MQREPILKFCKNNLVVIALEHASESGEIYFYFGSTEGYKNIYCRLLWCGTIESTSVSFFDVLLAKRIIQRKVPYLNTLTSLRAVGGFPTDGEVITPQL